MPRHNPAIVSAARDAGYPITAGPDRTNLIRYPKPNRLGLGPNSRTR